MVRQTFQGHIKHESPVTRHNADGSTEETGVSVCGDILASVETEVSMYFADFTPEPSEPAEPKAKAKAKKSEAVSE